MPAEFPAGRVSCRTAGCAGWQCCEPAAGGRAHVAGEQDIELRIALIVARRQVLQDFGPHVAFRMSRHHKAVVCCRGGTGWPARRGIRHSRSGHNRTAAGRQNQQGQGNTCKQAGRTQVLHSSPSTEMQPLQFRAIVARAYAAVSIFPIWG